MARNQLEELMELFAWIFAAFVIAILAYAIFKDDDWGSGGTV